MKGEAGDNAGKLSGQAFIGPDRQNLSVYSHTQDLRGNVQVSARFGAVVQINTPTKSGFPSQ